MDDAEKNMRQEIRDLKAEVQRLKRIIKGGITILCLVLLILFPQLLTFALGTAGMILFACLVSPVRGMIFSYIFRRDIR